MKNDHMLLLAGSDSPSPAPFLVIWGVVALIGGGALATKSVSARFHALVISGLAQRPGHQVGARAVHPGFVRAIGGFFAVCGLVALSVAVIMMARG